MLSTSTDNDNTAITTVYKTCLNSNILLVVNGRFCSFLFANIKYFHSQVVKLLAWYHVISSYHGGYE